MLGEAAKLASTRGLAYMTTAKAEASALPFNDASFDLVTCRLAAHHFPDLKAFVGEVRRVLKSGGKFALVDNVAPDASQLADADAAELGDAVRAYNEFEKLRDPSHGFAPPPNAWIDLLEDAGLKVIAREQFGKELDFASWFTRMRCAEPVVAELRKRLADASSPLATFLQPRIDDKGALHFTLQELLIVAEKTT
jgi:ubiquinone/menaquinone biosynthesis C-methylase UbiE